MARILLPLLAALPALLIPATAAAAPAQWTTFEAPRELLSDTQRDGALDEIAALGVRRVRALVYWRDYAPAADSATKPAFDAADPAAYPDWGRLDRLFAAAAARGVGVQLTLTGPVPRWATRSKSDQVTRPDPEEFEAFATAVGRRYGAQVDVWSVWNEPNHPQFLLPQFSSGKAASPRLYRKLFQAAQRGLAASGNGDDRLLLGETAPRGTPRVVAPLAFLRGTLCLSSSYKRDRSCGRLDAGGYAHHAYTTAAGPRFRPADADDVTIGVLSRLTRALDRAARAGALPSGLGIYLTEFGIQSTPDPYAGVSLAQQAEFLAIAEHIAYVNPRVRSFSQYLLTDDAPREGPATSRYSGFESGLRRSDGRAKPSYAGFRLPMVASDYGSSVVLWGRVRPAGGVAQVEVQVASASGRWKKRRTVTTKASGVWGVKTAHRSGQRYRVRWTAPEGKVYTGPPVRAY